MQRILIIGCGGSGKSSLAARLGDRLAIPVHHLDKLFWKPGWQPAKRDEFVSAIKEISGTEAWIMDGNYGGTMELRMSGADTIIFLDLPTVTCLWNVIKRYFRYRKRARPDMTEGNNERLNFEFLNWILSYRATRRPGIISMLREQSSEKNVIVLSSRKAIDQFISEPNAVAHLTWR